MIPLFALAVLVVGGGVSGIAAAYEGGKVLRSYFGQKPEIRKKGAIDLVTRADTESEKAIIETGMGGRLDATNMVKPAVSIISNISLEHRMYLGDTIAAIAGEKGGIIKYRTPVVTGARQKDAISVLESLAEKKKAPLYRFGRNFRVRRNEDQSFNYFGLDHTWRHLATNLVGPHQVLHLVHHVARRHIKGLVNIQ